MGNSCVKPRESSTTLKKKRSISNSNKNSNSSSAAGRLRAGSGDGLFPITAVSEPGSPTLANRVGPPTTSSASPYTTSTTCKGDMHTSSGANYPDVSGAAVDVEGGQQDNPPRSPRVPAMKTALSLRNTHCSNESNFTNITVSDSQCSSYSMSPPPRNVSVTKTPYGNSGSGGFEAVPSALNIDIYDDSQSRPSGVTSNAYDSSLGRLGDEKTGDVFEKTAPAGSASGSADSSNNSDQQRPPSIILPPCLDIVVDPSSSKSPILCDAAAAAAAAGLFLPRTSSNLSAQEESPAATSSQSPTNHNNLAPIKSVTFNQTDSVRQLSWGSHHFGSMMHSRSGSVTDDIVSSESGSGTTTAPEHRSRGLTVKSSIIKRSNSNTELASEQNLAVPQQRQQRRKSRRHSTRFREQFAVAQQLAEKRALRRVSKFGGDSQENMFPISFGMEEGSGSEQNPLKIFMKGQMASQDSLTFQESPQRSGSIGSPHHGSPLRGWMEEAAALLSPRGEGPSCGGDAGGGVVGGGSSSSANWFTPTSTFFDGSDGSVGDVLGSINMQSAPLNGGVDLTPPQSQSEPVLAQNSVTLPPLGSVPSQEFSITRAPAPPQVRSQITTRMSPTSANGLPLPRAPKVSPPTSSSDNDFCWEKEQSSVNPLLSPRARR